MKVEKFGLGESDGRKGLRRETTGRGFDQPISDVSISASEHPSSAYKPATSDDGYVKGLGRKTDAREGCFEVNYGSEYGGPETCTIALSRRKY